MLFSTFPPYPCTSPPNTRELRSMASRMPSGLVGMRIIRRPHCWRRVTKQASTQLRSAADPRGSDLLRR